MQFFFASLLGITNRIYDIVVARLLQKHLDLQVTIYWGITKDNGCKWEELFENGIPGITMINFDGYTQTEAHTKKQGELHKCHYNLDWLPIRQSVMRYACYYPSAEEIVETIKYILQFIKIDIPENIITLTSLAGGYENLIAVHVRRGDMVNHAKLFGFKDTPVDFILSVMKDVEKGKKIFLATDCDEAQELFKRILGKDNVLVADTIGKQVINGQRKTTVKHTIIDILMCSFCSRFIETETSTMSRLISLIREERLYDSIGTFSRIW